MAHLTSLQGRGGGRIPAPTHTATSLQLSRMDLAKVMQRVVAERYPHTGYHAALSALQSHPDAARLIREAAASYLTER